MKKYTVLVTGVGGNVGQGIVRNIRSLNQDIEIIGTNITSFSPGNHLCDRVFMTPFAYEDDFVNSLLHICESYKVDLIIPSTDFESLYLAEKSSIFPVIATSKFKTNQVFTDKYLTFEHFKKFQIPFVESALPSSYKGNFEEIILKPRMGRGSRGILINPTDFEKFSDEEYMIQELKKGVEITTAFYVDKGNSIHGHITMERKLENGTTILSLVTSKYDNLVIPMMEQMVNHFEISGSCNIQSIISSENELFPFEINGRISGTNSIRSNFGFEDVKYTLEENLFKTKLTPVQIQPGAATRILMDVIYPGITEWNQLNQADIKNYLY